MSRENGSKEELHVFETRGFLLSAICQVGNGWWGIGFDGGLKVGFRDSGHPRFGIRV